ncbi:MAG: lysophospholipid acyltransferase family protein [Acidobacteriota bacterium]
MKTDLGLALIPKLGSWFIRLLHLTLRVRHLHPERIEALNEEGQRYILAFWHCHLPMMFFSRYRPPIAVMSSQHRDGELSARNMEQFAVTVVRGSTTRGGSAALRGMLKLAAEGVNLAFTPDGPRGPARVVQSGVVAAAQLSGHPIIPIVTSAERKKKLRSWDSMEIPLPFSRLLFSYGEPIVVPRKLNKEELRRYQQLLEDRLNNLSAESEAEFDELFREARPEKRPEHA